ncbi:MAG: putative toxin-antitoxin system toxin component, PIN family [Bacteroidetes bacterium]|nr:MAG: putative toxin-antitoxin system toxin component, PIN family [Bacteroidota bacterium]
MLCVSTEILAEYAEIIESKMGHTASESLLGLIENLSNIELVTSYFKFGLLKDLDDNKFVDCAIACNATCIVTHDTDFNVLKSVAFPKVNCLDTAQFKDLFFSI